MPTAEEKRATADYNTSTASFRESESLVNKLIPMLAKVKAKPTPAVIKDTQSEIQLLQEILLRNNGIGDDPNVKKLLAQIVRHIRYQSISAEYQQSKELSKIIYPLLLQIGEYEDARQYMRGDLQILSHLYVLLDVVASHDERTILLRLIELYTRDLCMQWLSSSLVDVAQSVLKIVVKYPEENLELSLRILVNICSKDDKAVLFMKNSDEKKLAWKVFRDVVTKVGKSGNLFLPLMAYLNSLLDAIIPSHVTPPDHEIAKTILRDAFKNYTDTNGFIDRTLLVRQMVEVMCTRRSEALDTESLEQQTSLPSAFSAVIRSKILELVTACQEDLYKFVFDHSKELSDEMNEQILKLTLVLLSPFQFSTKEKSLVPSCTFAAQTARRVLTSAGKPGLQILAYKCILRVSELVFPNDNLTKEEKSVFYSLFRDVARSHNLDPALTLKGAILDLYTISLKLFSYLVTDRSFNENLKTRLNAAIASALFNKSSGADSCDLRHSLRLSVFSVELLNLMIILYPEEVAAFTSAVTVRTHLANCIRNGSKEEILRALQVASKLNTNSLILIAESLRQQQEVILSVPNTPSDLAVNIFNNTGSQTFTGVGSSLLQSTKEVVTGTPSCDLMELYDRRREVYQHEVNCLSSHIQQLNKTINNLHEMLTKQTVFCNRQIALNEKNTVELIAVQEKYDQETQKNEAKLKERDEQIKKEQHQSKQLQKSLAEKEDALKQSEATVASLQKETKGLQEKLAKMKDDLSVTTKNLATTEGKYYDLQKQFDSAQAEIAKLEDDVKLKDKEIEQLQNTLEKRQKILETIQGVLGPSFSKYDI